MNLQTRTVGDVMVLDLAGSVTLENCMALRERFLKVIKEGQRKLALNFSQVGYMDSSGLAVLIEILQKSKSSKVKIRLYGIQSRVQSLLEITNLRKALPIRDSEETVLRELTET